MPHCVIEYAKPIEQKISPATVVAAVHQAALGTGLFSPSAIKTRAQAYEHYLVGGQEKDFIHVTVSILEGRTPEQKAGLSSAVVQALATLDLTGATLSVDVQDMLAGSYSKIEG